MLSSDVFGLGFAFVSGTLAAGSVLRSFTEPSPTVALESVKLDSEGFAGVRECPPLSDRLLQLFFRALSFARVSIADFSFSLSSFSRSLAGAAVITKA